MSETNARPLILLVDDEPLMLDLLEAALAEGGFRLQLAEDGRAALDLLEREGGAFAGLVTDVNLGRGPNGWEVGRAGRQRNPNLAVVYMSGGSPHEWSAKGVPNSTILVKPFAPAQLVVALSTQLNVSDRNGDS